MIQMTKYIPAVLAFRRLAQSINSIKTACEAADTSVQKC